MSTYEGRSAGPSAALMVLQGFRRLRGSKHPPVSVKSPAPLLCYHQRRRMSNPARFCRGLQCHPRRWAPATLLTPGIFPPPEFQRHFHFHLLICGYLKGSCRFMYFVLGLFNLCQGPREGSERLSGKHFKDSFDCSSGNIIKLN